MKKIFYLLPVLFFSLFLSGCTLLKTEKQGLQNSSGQTNTTTTDTNSANVPLPNQEDIVRTFINLISEKRISEAISMMDPKAVGDDSQKQAWGVQFNSFATISLKAIEKNGADAFKVTLTVKMKPESEKGPIPYYGYDNGDNIRWIGLIKGSDNLWKITDFATSPINVDNGSTDSSNTATDSSEICNKFTKEFVSQTTGKSIIRTKPFSMSGTVSCSYYLEENSFIIIVQDNLNVEKQKQGLKFLGRTFSTSPLIKREHIIVYQEDSNVNEIILVINPNKFIRIDRSSLKALNNDEIINFAAKVAEKL